MSYSWSMKNNLYFLAHPTQVFVDKESKKICIWHKGMKISFVYYILVLKNQLKLPFRGLSLSRTASLCEFDWSSPPRSWRAWKSSHFLIKQPKLLNIRHLWSCFSCWCWMNVRLNLWAGTQGLSVMLGGKGNLSNIFSSVLCSVLCLVLKLSSS